MFTSFSTALSALSAMDTAIDVVGNNLANLNTTGFKTSEVCFEDLVTQSLGADLGETQVGFGVGQPLTVAQFTQGAIQTTGGVLDGAIQGDGFFIVQDPSGATQYTRAGNFQTDDSGNLLTDTGDAVQGWMVDPTTGQINTNGPIGNIVVPTGSLKPRHRDQQFHGGPQPELGGHGGLHLGFLYADHGVRQPGEFARVDGRFPEDRSQPVELPGHGAGRAT